MSLEGAVVEGLPPFVPADVQRFLGCLDLPFTSPVERALAIAEAIDSDPIRATFLLRKGDMAGSVRAHRKSMDVPGINHRLVLESLIGMLDREASTTVEDARAVRQEWWDRYAVEAAERQRPHTNVVDPEKRLTLGYITANAKHSSAGNCLEGVMLRHSKDFNVICYSTKAPNRSDPMSWVFEALVNVVDISTLSECELAARMCADGVDIAIDCMGFTYGNRLVALAERPAPVQVTGWGYATGTIPAMDAILLDAVTRGNDQFFEKPVNLPCVITYVPPMQMLCPEVAPAPTGPVRFGAFHCYIKINPDVLSTWRRIVDQVPGSVIVFKGGEYAEPALRETISKALNGRCEFLPQTQQMEHFAAFGDIDLVLDPWPQTGGITTCEALHMGVPSVTLIGERTIQRACASIMKSVGFDEGIATTKDWYVEKAADLVTRERARLARQRPLWRDRLRDSRVCGGYAEASEAVLRGLWRDYCDSVNGG